MSTSSTSRPLPPLLPSAPRKIAPVPIPRVGKGRAEPLRVVQYGVQAQHSQSQPQQQQPPTNQSASNGGRGSLLQPSWVIYSATPPNPAYYGPQTAQLNVPPTLPSIQQQRDQHGIVAQTPPSIPPNAAMPQKIVENAASIQISLKTTKSMGENGTPKVIRNVDTSEPRPGKYTRYSFAQRVRVLTLATHKYQSRYIEAVTGVKQKAQQRIYKTAVSRGYDFLRDPRILDAYVVDGVKPGRPRKKKTDDTATTEADGAKDNNDGGESEHNGEGIPVLETSDTVNTSEVAQQQFKDVTMNLAGIQEYLARAQNSEKT